jgi:hypothetical protein
MGEAGLSRKRLEDLELVGVTAPWTTFSPRPQAPVISTNLVEARFGVDGEHHAGRRQVGAHHLLHADRQRHLLVVEPVEVAVGDRPVGEERGVAAAAGRQQRLGRPRRSGRSPAGRRSWRPADPRRWRWSGRRPRVRCCRCVRTIPGRPTGSPHGYRRANRPRQWRRGPPCRFRPACACRVEHLHRVGDHLIEIVGLDEGAEGVGCGGKAGGTSMPFSPSCCTISPRDEFLPPTRPTSPRDRSSNQMTFLLAADMRLSRRLIETVRTRGNYRCRILPRLDVRQDRMQND